MNFKVPVSIIFLYFYTMCSRRSIWPVFLLLLTFFSCKKDQDVNSPVIIVSSPYENQQFSVFDEVIVRAEISDDRKLEYITIVLEDENFIPVLRSVTIHPENNVFQLDISYLLNDIHLPSGDYYLLLRASDGINEKNKFVKIGIAAVPKKLECTYLVEPLTGQLVIQKLDTAGNITTVMTRPPDHSAAALSSDYSMLLLCGRYSEDLVAFDLGSMQESWHIDVVNSPPFPYFENMVYDDRKLFVAYHDGRWEYFDLSGFMIASKVTDHNWLPENFLVLDQYLITSQKQLSGFDNKLVVYYLNSATVKLEVSVDVDVVNMFAQYADQFLIFGNTGGQGFIQLHDVSNGYLYDPLLLPPGAITCVERLSDKDFAVAIDNTVFVYNDETTSLSTLVSGSGVSAMRYEPLTAVLYLVPATGGNTMKMVRWPGGQYLGSVSTAGAPSEILFQYNRE